jgi:hypothetical protein
MGRPQTENSNQISSLASKTSRRRLNDMSIMQGQKKIEKTVVGGYKAIESGVVGVYKKIEEGVVSSYKKIEDKFVEAFLAPKEAEKEEN